MIRKVVRIENELGLHARAAARLVKLTSKFESRITLSRMNRPGPVDGKSILGIMLLAAAFGTEVEITVEGADEEAAMAEILRLVEKKFNEGK
jgi:phosphocarrier protein